jgi:hypothetical protein
LRPVIKTHDETATMYENHNRHRGRDFRVWYCDVEVQTFCSRHERGKWDADFLLDENALFEFAAIECWGSWSIMQLV